MSFIHQISEQTTGRTVYIYCIGLIVFPLNVTNSISSIHLSFMNEVECIEFTVNLNFYQTKSKQNQLNHIDTVRSFVRMVKNKMEIVLIS